MGKVWALPLSAALFFGACALPVQGKPSPGEEVVDQRSLVTPKTEVSEPVPQPSLASPDIPGEKKAPTESVKTEKKSQATISPPETLSTRLNQVYQLLADGDNSAASSVLEKLHSDFPNDAEVLYTLVLFFDSQEESQKRDTALQKLSKLAPSHPGVALFRGQRLMKKRRYEDAVDSFSTVLKHDPSNLDALKGKARALLHGEHSEEALPFLEAAQKIDPTDPYLYVDKSHLLISEKKYGEAEKALTEAIKLDPTSQWHYLDRGRLRLREMRHIKAAREDFLKVEKINPKNFFALVYLAGIYDELRDYQQAFVYYKKVLNQKKNYAFAHAPLGKIYTMKKKWEQAAFHFLEAYKRENPQEKSYELSAVVALLKMGEKKEAQKILQNRLRTLKRDSTLYEIYRYLAEGGDDFYITNKIAKEKDKTLKNKALYYAGTRYGIDGAAEAERAAYTKIANEKGSFEVEIAREFLQKFKR